MRIKDPDRDVNGPVRSDPGPVLIGPRSYDGPIKNRSYDGPVLGPVLLDRGPIDRSYRSVL